MIVPLLVSLLISPGSPEHPSIINHSRSEVTPPSVSCAAMMCLDEELVYEVSWLFVKLGTVRLKTLRVISPDTSLHKAAAFIDSYSLPFVDMHSVVYTEVDSTFVSRAAASYENINGNWWGLHYKVDEEGKRVVVEESWRKVLESRPDSIRSLDPIRIPHGRVQEGLSIAYYARANIHTRKTVSFPTFAYAKLGETWFRFSGERTTVAIDAVERPVRVVQLNGRLDLEGLYGLTGEFTGYFSDDSAAVPIKAKLNVLLGSVTVELVRWHRPGWVPPQEGASH